MPAINSMHIQEQENELPDVIIQDETHIAHCNNNSKILFYPSSRKISTGSINSVTCREFNSSDQELLINPTDVGSINTVADDDEKSTDEDEKLIRTPKDLVMLVCMAFLFFTATMNISMMSPFFTPVAATKGIGLTLVGLIFGIYPLCVFLISPIAGKWLPVVGARFCLFAGSFLEGGSLILFGFVIDMPSKTTFILFCFLIRAVTAIGTAFAEVACLTILSMYFKKRMTIVFGLLELFTGLGLMSGPALGSLIYKAGGFRLPFLISGGINFIVIFIIYWLLPTSLANNNSEEEDKDGTFSIFSVLSIPGVLMLAIVTATGGISISFIEPVLTNHVQDITHNGLSIVHVGLIFLLSSGVYTFAAPVVGTLIGKKINGRIAIIVGHFIGAACFMFLGPSPLLKSFVNPQLWVVCLSLAVTGIAYALHTIPTLNEMQISASNHGLADNLGRSSMLSGLFQSAFSIGSVLGPALSGTLTEHTSFAWASTVLALLLLAEGVILILFTIWERKSHRNLKNRRNQVC